MTRKSLVIALTILFAVVLYAKDNKEVKLTGFLLDNNCTSGHETDKDFAEQAAKQARFKDHIVPWALRFLGA